MSEYIIRYKYGSKTEWHYFVGIARDGELSSDTCSTIYSDSKKIVKMSLENARDSIIKIEKIRKKHRYGGDITEIQILNATTNKEIEDGPTSRFELIDI